MHFIFFWCTFLLWHVLLKGHLTLSGLRRVEVLIVNAGKVSALEFPDSHVLVPAGDELQRVVWIKLHCKDRQEAEVTKGQRAFLFPLEDLDRESLVHT